MKDKKKLLVIQGSPHKNGATAKMAAELSKAFLTKGWECEFIDIYEKKLEPCRGCMMCRDTGDCVINDNIAQIAQALVSCDTVVLAAPVYFANVPGPVKNLFDRLSGVAVDRKAKPKLKGRYILMTACTTPAPFDKLAGQSSGALRAMKEFFKMAGMTCAGRVVYPAARSDAKLPETVLRKIRRLAT